MLSSDVENVIIVCPVEAKLPKFNRPAGKPKLVNAVLIYALMLLTLYKPSLNVIVWLPGFPPSDVVKFNKLFQICLGCF